MLEGVFKGWVMLEGVFSQRVGNVRGCVDPLQLLLMGGPRGWATIDHVTHDPYPGQS